MGRSALSSLHLTLLQPLWNENLTNLIWKCFAVYFVLMPWYSLQKKHFFHDRRMREFLNPNPPEIHFSFCNSTAQNTEEMRERSQCKTLTQTKTLIQICLLTSAISKIAICDDFPHTEFVLGPGRIEIALRPWTHSMDKTILAAPHKHSSLESWWIQWMSVL